METPITYFEALNPCRNTLDKETIHQLRKGTKHLRAHLHLLRQLEGQQKETENLRAAVKKLARMLSVQRDADVLYSLLEDMIRETDDAELVALLAGLKDKLEDKRLAPSELKRVLGLTRDIKKKTHELLGKEPLENDIKAILTKRLSEFCETGEEILFLNITDWEELHDWRKQAKKLMYQHKMIRHQTPAELKIVETLDSLGDELGKINDLKIMDNYLKQQQLLCTRAYTHELYQKLYNLIGEHQQHHLSSCRNLLPNLKQLK
ncbi:CHAD domain-containing protein [Gammaproteobacteria bacterium]|nr:CHAD domain-containing protein [Gammaproteobacteria bacterium]